MSDDKPKSRVDIAREAGPPGISRRFVGVDLSTGQIIQGTLVESQSSPSTDDLGTVKVRKPQAKRVLKRAEKAAKPLAKPKGRGRPKKHEEPWKAAGISRAAWFRKQKAKA